MTQSNTEEDQPVESTEKVTEADIEQVEEKVVEQNVQAIQGLFSELDIEGVLVFRFPDDPEDSWRHIRQGHFYDTLQMLSEYVRESKKRIAEDLNGIA